MEDYAVPKSTMTKFERKQAKHNGSTKDMIQCPHCKAWSYPRVFVLPVDNTEENAIICGSCHKDLYPYITMLKEFEKRMQGEWTKNKENGILLKNEEGIEEMYPDAKKIMAEVMGDFHEGKLQSTNTPV